MKNLLINLPEDLFINDILLSNSKVLPIKSLLSLRCVCKYLRNLITSPAFIKLQISKELNNNINNNTLVLLNPNHRHDVFFSLKFNDDDDPCHPEEDLVEFVSPIEYSNIWGSCNGLVCLSERQANVIVWLWNPFTKEFKILPPALLPSTEIPIVFPSADIPIGGISGSITYGFGYDRLLDDYKIIRCSQHFLVRDNDYTELNPMLEFQVYTLGTNTWRKISTDNNPYSKSYFVLSLFPSSIIFVNGALHWIMSTSSWLLWDSADDDDEAEAEVKIVSFDIEKEVIREKQTPLMAKFKPDLCFSPELQVLRGCLCVLELDSNTKSFCNVWMMMNYGVKESWTKLFKILSSEASVSMNGLPSTYRLLRFCKNGIDILVESHDSLVVYDPINNKGRFVEFGKFGMCMYESEIYIETLVSLNSGLFTWMKTNRIRVEEEEENSGIYMDEKRIRVEKSRVSEQAR